ncbi:MAG: ribosome small subunit-dependent GTPase A [Clostridiales bacterium]|nr:ribosome small subunit-dependent GTPase A [Clostridiales bacterium]
MESRKQGKIIKGVGGFYTVLGEDGKKCVCKARGLFRKNGQTPLPGDNVEFSFNKKDGGYLISILPRENELIRPAVANIDLLLIVVSAQEPLPDLELADKLLLYCAKQRIEPVLVINKCDNGTNESAASIIGQYDGAVDKIVCVSAETGYGMDALRELLMGRTICLAGQSAVGKSSMLNTLLGLELKTGELSAKTERGRHTTRHAELIPMPNGTLIADTPGFSMLETVSVEPEEIPLMYRDFSEYSNGCRFVGCMHVSEPDCAVKEAVENGNVNRERYSRYVKILNEAIEIRRHKYD